MAPSLCQIALSVRDIDRTFAFYADGLGLLPTGGGRIGGSEVAALQGLPECDAEVRWLVDAQHAFQLELFAYSAPAPRPPLADRRPSDIGYSCFSVHVADFDGTLVRLGEHGSAPIGPTVGGPGGRRAVVPDPGGVLVELMEDDPRGPERRDRTRPHVGAAIRGVRLAVDDLERAVRFWEDTLALRRAPDDALHRVEHEAAWCLPDARRDVVALWAHDIVVEIARYRSPASRSRPAGYRISDLGILNVALGGLDRDVYDEAYARVRRGGYHHTPPMVRPDVRATYVEDDQGFSLELLYNSRNIARQSGFEPWESA